MIAFWTCREFCIYSIARWALARVEQDHKQDHFGFSESSLIAAMTLTIEVPAPIWRNANPCSWMATAQICRPQIVHGFLFLPPSNACDSGTDGEDSCRRDRPRFGTPLKRCVSLLCLLGCSNAGLDECLLLDGDQRRILGPLEQPSLCIIDLPTKEEKACGPSLIFPVCRKLGEARVLANPFEVDPERARELPEALGERVVPR
jgi:hypothetical protein